MAAQKPKVLVVEDERDVRDLMMLHLKREGLEPLAVEDGEEALRVVSQKEAADEFDLVILDWMLPGVSGLEICKSLKGKFPILMVTARADTSDIVLGLEMGADDYLTKPFEIAVFLARVRALLRRTRLNREPEPTTGGERFSVDGLVVEVESHRVTCGGEEIQLTASEFKLLTALMRNQGRVLSRDKLIEQVQGQGIVVIDRAIDTHVFGLRKKLGACSEVIETIRGVGYRVKAG